MCSVAVLSCIQLFETPWTIAHQTPLSMGILQARALELVAMPSSRGSSQPRDQTQVSRIAGRFFTIWATKEAYDPVIPLLGIYLKKLTPLIWNETCIPMLFTAALFTVAKIWKQPKHPSADEGIKKMWRTYTMEHYSALQRTKWCHLHQHVWTWRALCSVK